MNSPCYVLLLNSIEFGCILGDIKPTILDFNIRLKPTDKYEIVEAYIQYKYPVNNE